MQKKLDEITAAVTAARPLPMSASCVVNRAGLLALLDEARAALPGSLDRARELVGERERLVAGAREEARRIVEDARADRAALVAGSPAVLDARAEADRILGEARRAAAEIRAEADEYVDAKLANFEVLLTRTVGSVGRGREELAVRPPGPADPLNPVDPADPVDGAHPMAAAYGTPLPPGGAGAYADATLGALEEVLSRTLEAVGRGRTTLSGRTGESAANETAGAPGEPGFPGPRPEHATSDAEYLAGLAESAGAAPWAGFPPVPPVPPAPPLPEGPGSR
ncbi:ATP synthase F0 subunit B [Streptomyces sp. NPDC003691]